MNRRSVPDAATALSSAPPPAAVTPFSFPVTSRERRADRPFRRPEARALNAASSSWPPERSRAVAHALAEMAKAPA